MTRCLLRLTGTALLIGVALVIPTLVVTSAPASAQVVVDGCTIVSNPTPSNFTNCPGANLSSANLTGVNLSYADLGGATFVSCTASVPSGVECTSAILSGTKFTSADLADGSFAVCLSTWYRRFGTIRVRRVHSQWRRSHRRQSRQRDLCSLHQRRPHFRHSVCPHGPFRGQPLGRRPRGGDPPDPLSGVLSERQPGRNHPQRCQLHRHRLVPSDQTVVATSSAGAVVAWPTPPSLPGATPVLVHHRRFDLPAPARPPSLVRSSTAQATLPPGPSLTVMARRSRPRACSSHANGATLSGRRPPGRLRLGRHQRQFLLFGGDLWPYGSRRGRRHSNHYGWLRELEQRRRFPTVPTSCCRVPPARVEMRSVPGVRITVNNAPFPTTSVLVPSTGATLSGGGRLDASASLRCQRRVRALRRGIRLQRSRRWSRNVSLYGWRESWNTTTVPSGTYSCYRRLRVRSE